MDIFKTLADIYEIISSETNIERENRLKILHYIVKEQLQHKIKPLDVKELIKIIDNIHNDLTKCANIYNIDEILKSITKLESIKKLWKLDCDFVEGDKYEISQNKYLLIYDYDINIYAGKSMVLKINTYPNDPKIILKLINHFE